MSTQDQINQGVVAAFVCELVWPQTKILPKNWTKWRDDKNSLSQMILKKVSVPVGIEGRMYWESMLLSMTNGKFCSLSQILSKIYSSNFKVRHDFSVKYCRNILLMYVRTCLN